MAEPAPPGPPTSADLRARARALLGRRGTVVARSVLRGLGLPRWGNLRRTAPFSRHFGFERGTPVDRHYLHRFLEAERASITGDVLEIQGDGHTRRFGQALGVVHTVDINPDFAATYTCDLALADGIIPSNRYDAFLLPNTLCVLRDIEGCLRQALRVVRPGGVVLATTATFVPLNPDTPDYWRLTAEGWRELAARVWDGHAVTIEAHGNCLASVAAMLGLAAEELTEPELDVQDPLYPVLVTLKVVKAA
jgi:SAM-dependent methyltransferase